MIRSRVDEERPREASDWTAEGELSFGDRGINSLRKIRGIPVSGIRFMRNRMGSGYG